MRISENRYDRERCACSLLWRFLEHEARTQTIRTWTGLSDDRIRKLYRSYMTRARRYVPRHRGKSPHQIAYFARSVRVQQETGLAGEPAVAIRCDSGAADFRSGDKHCRTWARGELLCHAFEVLSIDDPYLADLVRAHRVSRDGAITRGAAETRRLCRLWEPRGHRAVSRPRQALPSTARARCRPASKEASFVKMRAWIMIGRISSRARISTAVRSCARTRTGSQPR